MNNRIEYYKQYYQNNKDKYKKEYRVIRYCKVCEKEFINITRHRQTDRHKFLMRMFNRTEEDGGILYERLRTEPCVPLCLEVLPEPVPSLR